MDLALTEEQEALRDAVARMLDKTSSPEQVREAEPLGWSADVWSALASMGVPTMGVPDQGGATLVDLGVVAREAGAHLAPVPVVEAMVASRLLARFGHSVDDTLVRTMALRPASRGLLSMVPGAAVASEVVALDGDDLVVLGPPATAPEPHATMASAALADVVMSDATSRVVLASGPAAATAHAAALDEWRALTAQWLVGLGRAAFAIGVQYVKDRKQFGVPIGSFQAIGHRLADQATALDGAELLADKATWSLDRAESLESAIHDAPALAPGSVPLAQADAARTARAFPALAYTFAGETAQQVASTALHHHGGYGFMEEYDIQLHFRRAKAARLVLADPRREMQHVADRLFGPPEGEAG